MTRKIIKPFLAGLAVIFLGSFIVTDFNLYDTFPHIDKLFHVSGGFIVAWFFAVLWVDYLRQASPFQRFLTLVSVAVFVGVFWEIAEYSTSVYPLSGSSLIQHYLYIGDIVDTLGDLLADMFGAALAALILRLD